MVQRKKEKVRDAILKSAFQLFSESGYSETSIPAIAHHAGFSTANVYVYFNSKIEILFTLYEPWLQERLDSYEKSLARTKTAHKRLEKILMFLWHDLPRASNGFSNNVMQAVATSLNSNEYDPKLRRNFQARVARWIQGCLQSNDEEAALLANVVLMAFDGFAMNVHLAHSTECDSAMAAHFCKLMLLGASGNPAA